MTSDGGERGFPARGDNFRTLDTAEAAQVAAVWPDTGTGADRASEAVRRADRERVQRLADLESRILGDR